jgi:hypothetical protein
MRIRRTSFALLVALIAATDAATAQQAPTQPDSARGQIQSTLRAFYFNLAHGDWEALTDDILAAKVMASRTAPATIAGTSHSHGDSGSASVACTSNASRLVNRAVITLDREWAEVSVPRCTVAARGADEFRLVRFEERWRIVGIRLFQEPVAFSAER